MYIYIYIYIYIYNIYITLGTKKTVYLVQLLRKDILAVSKTTGKVPLRIGKQLVELMKLPKVITAGFASRNSFHKNKIIKLDNKCEVN